MNYRMIKYTLGWLLLFEALFFTLPILTAIIYTERAGLAFFYSMLICGAVGGLCIMKKPENTVLYSKDGFATVSLSWIALSLFGSLPFMFSGVTPKFIDALFETVSGFSTTGASIFSDVEALPKCINLWRCFTHWVGGMGVLVFIMAFLPLGGAHNMHLMKAESTGPNVSKLVPRVRNTAATLYGIYLIMTLVQLVFLLCGGMSLFDAICTAFGTAGTGGFGIKNDSFASESSYIQIVVAVFMLLFSINFNSYYLIIKGNLKDALSAEVKAFIVIVLGAITIISLDAYLASENFFATLGESIKHALFTVASIISTTGYMSFNYDIWPELSRTIIVILMFIGACAGSTGGGIKVSRLMILFKGMTKEIGQIIHPKQVKKLTLDKKPIEHEVIRSVNAYIVCYIAIFAISILALSFNELDLVTNFTAVTASFNNIGPGLAKVGPTCNYSHFGVFSKLILIFDMLAGRLELFPMLILFAPGTWKKR